MIEFLILWVGTSAASLYIEIKTALRILKDVADVGYKIDIKGLSEWQSDKDEQNGMIISMFIPIFNLMQAFQHTINYNDNRAFLIDQLKVMDALEEMSEAEKKEYLKNPTGLNVMTMLLKSEERLANASSVTINNSKIYYEMGEELLNDITILKVTGPLASLTVEEQKKKVIEAWKTIIISALEKYGDEKAFVEALKKMKNINLNDIENEKQDEKTLVDTPKSNSNMNLSNNTETKNDGLRLPKPNVRNRNDRQKQIQELENLKKEIEILEKQEVDQSTKTNKGRTLSKKRK